MTILHVTGSSEKLTNSFLPRLTSTDIVFKIWTSNAWQSFNNGNCDRYENVKISRVKNDLQWPTVTYSDHWETRMNQDVQSASSIKRKRRVDYEHVKLHSRFHNMNSRWRFTLEKSKCSKWVHFIWIKVQSVSSSLQNGYIDVGDKWMLVTLSWWQFLDVSDRILILAISFGCWFPTLI